MKKILFVASTIEHIENFHLPYLEELGKLKYEITVLSNKEKTINFVDRTIGSDFKKQFVSFKNIKEIFKIKKLLETENYDIVILHTTLASFCVRMAIKLLKNKPKVVYMCHGYLFIDNFKLKNRIYLLCEKMVAKVTDKLIVMNEVDLKIAKKYKLGKEIFFTNGIGINLDDFNFCNDDNIKNRYRKKYNINHDDIVFLNVAEFSKRKNQKEIIYALHKLNNPNIKLIFAGIGKELDKCKRLVKKFRLDENVIFLGYVKDISKLYIACDYYVSASKSEGIPFSVLEASSVGLPLVLSNVKGHKDIIKNARGLVFNNKKELVKKMNDIQIYKREENELKKYDISEIKTNIIKIYIDKNI